MSAWQYNQAGGTDDQEGLTYDGGLTELLGGGWEWRHGGYISASDHYRNNKKLLEEVEQEIATIEREEKPLIKKAKRNTEAAIELLALQEEINALRLEREALLRMIDDEEAIFILLAATPFN